MSDSSEGDRSSGGPLPATAAPQVNPTEPLPTPEGSTAVIGGYLDGLLPAAGGRVDRVSQRVQDIVRWVGDTSPGRLIMPLLRGNTWLGHPVHPVVVTVPIGAWVVSSWYDLRSIRTGRKRDEYAADGSLRIGIASAVPAAVTGIAQFLDTRDHTRRETAVHAGPEQSRADAVPAVAGAASHGPPQPGPRGVGHGACGRRCERLPRRRPGLPARYWRQPYLTLIHRSRQGQVLHIMSDPCGEVGSAGFGATEVGAAGLEPPGIQDQPLAGA